MSSTEDWCSDYTMAVAVLPISLIPPPPPLPSASVSSVDRKPPPLIQAAGSDATPTGSGQQVSPGEQRKRNSKGGAKRKKYCTEDERLGKEKERRCANNQRERSVWESIPSVNVVSRASLLF